MGKFLNTTPLSKKHTPLSYPLSPLNFKFCNPSAFADFEKISDILLIPEFQISRNQMNCQQHIM